MHVFFCGGGARRGLPHILVTLACVIGEALAVDAPKVERARAEAIVCMAGG